MVDRYRPRDYDDRDFDRGRDFARWDRGYGSDYGRDRDEFAGARGGGYLGGDYGRIEFDRGRDFDRDFDRGRDFAGGFDRDFDRGRDDFDRGRDFGVDRADERPSYRGRGPKGFQRSDDRLRELVSERLEDHHAIDASDIEVTVSNGEVTLSGTVDDRRTKRLAEDVAESVHGVRDVHNNLKVDRNFFGRSGGNA